MSDTPQGPGWWQASDGKFYPPEQAPAERPQAPGGVPASGVDIGAAITYGWNKFVQYIGQIIILVLVILGVNIVVQIVANSIGRNDFAGIFIGFVVSILGILISYILAAGIIRAALAVTRGEEPSASMLFQTDHLASYVIASILVSLLTFVGLFVFCIGAVVVAIFTFFYGFYVIASILVSLLTFVGLFVFCIGAVVVAIFTFFYGFYVIDRGDAPVESIQNSFNLVKNNFGGVLGFVIIAVVLNLVTCGLAYGVTYIAGAYVYRTLNGEPVAA
jgi:uncharacterized membrane protein